MPDRFNSKRFSSLLAFLRPRRSRASIMASDGPSSPAADASSSRSRTITPSPKTPATSTTPTSPAVPAPAPTSPTSIASPPMSPPAVPSHSEVSSPTASSTFPDSSNLTVPGLGYGQPSTSPYDPSRAVSSATFGSRMSGLNELDVAKFPLPPDHEIQTPTTASTTGPSSTDTSLTVKPKPVVRSESTPVFSLGDEPLDLTLSNPSVSPTNGGLNARPSQQSNRSSISGKTAGGFLRRASSVGLRLAGQSSPGKEDKSRPTSLMPPPQVPQIDLKFDVGVMDVDFNPAKAPMSQSTATL